MEPMSRRAFAAGLGLTLAATALTRSAEAVPAPGTFPALRQIDAGVLDVGYAEMGPPDGPAVILLHGWPYDIHSFIEVAPLLAARGHRVLMPYLRGFGSTRFISAAEMRTAQQAALAQDLVDFMDALEVDRAILAGFDWGARVADGVAAVWPQRCRGLVSVSGYLIVDLAANLRPLPPAAELGWWYQYYFATQRGEEGYRANTRDFNELIWRQASPRWDFDAATFDRSAAAFDNADHVAIVIHNYRWRLSLAEGDPRYAELDRLLGARPTIGVPTITIGSDFDGPNKDGHAYRGMFTGPYAHRVLDGIGHNVPQEAPVAFADAVTAVRAL
jgi:pimeloyl-ACP methyl ester carboxylesterase